jgi:ribonuclease D
MSEKPYILVADDASLADAVAHLRAFPLLALDLEMENNFHHYGLHVALIQVSAPDGANIVVDPLAGLDLDPLGRLLTDPGVELILHDSDFDRRTCREIYGWRLTRLFDTKVAAQLCGIRQFGLAPLLSSLFGVATNKKFQRLDWMRRPLREDALEYASSDTRHLFELRRVLLERLEALGRVAWVQEECARQERDVDWNDRPALHHRIKGSAKLTGRQLAVLAAMVAFRDGLARRMDRPAGFLIPDRRLMEWAVTPPASVEAVRAVPGLPRALYRTDQASALLEAIAAGTRAPEDQHPKWQRRGEPPVRGHEQRLKAMQQWRAEKAAPLDLEPYLILPNDVLEWRARHPGRPYPEEVASQIRTWQRNLLWRDFEAAFPDEPPSEAVRRHPGRGSMTRPGSQLALDFGTAPTP